MSIRDLNKLPLAVLFALTAACGGGAEQAAATPEATDAAASGTPTVAMDSPAAPTTTATPAPTASVTPDAGGTVHTVRMVSTNGGASGVFEPAQLTVKKGDVIRWVMADGVVMHNVSFTSAQGNPAGAQLPADSPYLTQQDQSYEAKIEAGPGTYNYVCVPHQAMGMTGSITVQ